MPAQTLTIEFPETAAIPQDATWDQDLLRYAVAGALFVKGLLSREEAQRLTGDPGRVFEMKMRELGFSSQTKQEPLQEPGVAPSREQGGRWARVAEYFSSEKAGHLNGRSDQAMECIRDFRKGFDL